jgi:hypothetical protein
MPLFEFRKVAPKATPPLRRLLMALSAFVRVGAAGAPPESAIG